MNWIKYAIDNGIDVTIRKGEAYKTDFDLILTNSAYYQIYGIDSRILDCNECFISLIDLFLSYYEKSIKQTS